MLGAALATASAPEPLTLLRRGFGLDFGAAYLVTPARPDCLSLRAVEGLPEDYEAVARVLSLTDYADIADLPYNDKHTGGAGEFFAPVAAAFSMRAWLFLTLTPTPTNAPCAALLLGSRDPSRFTSADTLPLFALAQAVSAGLAARFPEINPPSLART